jgi:Xaa-Pro dipeptidase
MDDSLHRLQGLMQDAELDLLALLPGPNLYYLTGLNFHLMERPTVLLVPAAGEAAVVLPELEAERAAALQPDLQRFAYGEADVDRINAFELLSQLRLRKSKEEIQRMHQAIQIAETAIRKTLPAVAEGMSEKELAAELVVQLLRAGSEPDLPFSPIVASGPNSALPHATPTDRKLASGDMLIIDWGARYLGYISDLTRTFSIGPPPSRMTEIHALVERANQAARQAAHQGVTVEQVDRAARAVIEAGGFGEFFTHRTGHGIGLEAHEPPGIRSGDDLRLEPGMTFTIEPGIYLPGEGGVRIEDNVSVTEGGLQVLSSLPRGLSELP